MTFTAEPPEFARPPGWVRRRLTAVRPVRLALAGPIAGLSLSAGIAVAAFASPNEPPADSSIDFSSASDVLDVIPPIVAPGLEVEVAIETVEQSLAPGSFQQTDAFLPEGLTKIVSKGKPGVALVTYSVSYSDGIEVERVELTNIVVTAPIDDVVTVGTLDVPERPAIVPGSNRAIGQEIAASHGWTGIEWQCLDNLWEKESNWRHLVANPSSGAYGIPQALPAEKMATVASDWMTNPATQIEWGLTYIEGRYGTPCYAWGVWSNHSPHWY